MSLQVLEALDAAKFDFTAFLRVEFGPLAAMELLEKVQDKQGVYEVQKCVTHVCLVLEVNRQVKEVVLPLVVFVNLAEQQLLRVFVGDVPHHERGAWVFTPFDLLNIKLVNRLVETSLRGVVEVEMILESLVRLETLVKGALLLRLRIRVGRMHIIRGRVR